MQQPIVLQENKNITHLSGYRTPTIARYYFDVAHEWDIQHLREIFAFSQQENLPILIVSCGTNLLFAEPTYRGIIIKNSLTGWEYDKTTKILKSFANESIWHIAETIEEQYHNSLWHRFIWLPGSIGGAVYGNAGCFGLETESNFLSAKIFDMKEGQWKDFSKGEMGFAYRHSMLKEHPEYFLVSASFDLSKKVEKYHSDVDNIDFRENKQPKGYSCGSFFKNPSTIPPSFPQRGGEKPPSAGSLIESVWLKGYQHGGASWSPLHANFLMSDGVVCTGKDLYELVLMTQEKVKKDFGIDLINEVKIIKTPYV